MREFYAKDVILLHFPENFSWERNFSKCEVTALKHAFLTLHSICCFTGSDNFLSSIFITEQNQDLKRRIQALSCVTMNSDIYKGTP